MRRHRLGVAATAVMAVGMAAGTVGSTVGLVRARRAEVRTLREAQAKRQVADFLKNVFKVSNPSEARGNSITARELLDKAAGTVDKSGTELGHRILFEIVEDSPVHGSTSSPVPGSNGHADERRTVNL